MPRLPRRLRTRTEAPDDLDESEWNKLAAWIAEKEPWAAPEITDLIDNCLDHHRARGSLMADWVAACRTWIRNERLWRRRKGGPSSGAPQQAPRGGVAGAAHRVARDLGLFGLDSDAGPYRRH